MITIDNLKDTSVELYSYSNASIGSLLIPRMTFSTQRFSRLLVMGVPHSYLRVPNLLAPLIRFENLDAEPFEKEVVLTYNLENPDQCFSKIIGEQWVCLTRESEFRFKEFEIIALRESPEPIWEQEDLEALNQS